MFDGREGEIANRITRVLLDILPEGAESITAHSEALADWASTRLQFEKATGTASHFSFEEHPDDAVDELNRALIDLRRIMLEDGQEEWYGATFTAYRGGRFTLDFSYATEEVR